MVPLFFKHPRGFLLLLETLYDLAPLPSLSLSSFFSYCVSTWFSHIAFLLFPTFIMFSLPQCLCMRYSFCWENILTMLNFDQSSLSQKNNMPLLCCFNHSTNVHGFDWQQLPHYIVSSLGAETILLAIISLVPSTVSMGFHKLMNFVGSLSILIWTCAQDFQWQHSLLVTDLTKFRCTFPTDPENRGKNSVQRQIFPDE